MKTLTGLALLAAAVLPAAGPAERFEYDEPHMGTRFRVVLYAPDRATADRAAKAAFARVGELNDIMSDYLPTSELMRLCKANAKTLAGPTRVGDDLFAVLDHGQRLARDSGGAFDVTVGPLSRLWRLSRRTGRLPSAEELARARAVVGHEKVRLDAAAKTVRFTVPGVQLDLGGIAKGYAADAALDAMAKHGVGVALVAAGGDVTVRGAPPGTDGWQVDVAPLTGNAAKYTLRLRDAAVSTSGDANQAVTIDGVRYSHVLDPRTGLGLTGRRSVTVVAKDGTTADSTTKAVSVAPERGLAIVERTAGAAALVIELTDGGEKETRTGRFADYLAK